MTLPSDYDEMESYIQKNKVKLMEQIVLSVQYALDNEYPSVEVFTFKNSDFIVILTQSEFKDNILLVLNIDLLQFPFSEIPL